MRVKLFIHSCILGGCLYIGLVKHLAPFVDERKLCDSHMEVAPSTLNARALHLPPGTVHTMVCSQVLVPHGPDQQITDCKPAQPIPVSL